MPPGNECLIVSDEAKRATEECARAFACLSGNIAPCKVEQCQGQEVLVCLNREYCRYQVRFGFADYLCTCPVRNELHKRYQL